MSTTAKKDQKKVPAPKPAQTSTEQPAEKDDKKEGDIITDKRFAAIHSSMKFQKLPKKAEPHELDDRFKKVKEDPKFDLQCKCHRFRSWS